MITVMFLSIIVSIFIVIGQVLWKLGVGDRSFNLSNLFGILKSPFFIIGAIIYIFAAIIWLYLLSKYQYHYIYPLILSLAFIFSLIASHFILHEQISYISLLGILILCIGVIVISIGYKFS